MDEQTDLEAIAAFNEYYRALADDSVRTAHAAMRCALDKAASVRIGGVTSEDAWERRGPWGEIARNAAIANKKMTERLLGESLYSARMALQRRAEAAESQLAERDAEIARLREMLTPYFEHWDHQARGHSPQSSIWHTNYTPVTYEHHENTRTALSPPIAAKQDDHDDLAAAECVRYQQAREKD